MRHRSIPRLPQSGSSLSPCRSHIHTVAEPSTHWQSQELLAFLLTSLQSKVILALVAKANEIFSHAVQVNWSCRMCHKNELVIQSRLTGLLCVEATFSTDASRWTISRIQHLWQGRPGLSRFIEVPLYHAHKLPTTILSLTNYCQEVFRPRLEFPAWAMGHSHPEFFLGGRLPTLLPRAGAHGLQAFPDPSQPLSISTGQLR